MSTSNHKTGVSQEQDKRHKRTLAACVKEEGNRFCADCGCRGPTWASVNLGVFVCLTCSGIHRSLGVHISQVRSTTLDTWLPKQVTFVTLMGNVKANKYWEKKLPVNFVRPSDTMKLTSFIRSKYVDQLYVPDDMPPPNIENYKNHPYCSASTDIASTFPQEETQTKPIGLKGTPKVSVLDPPRKTTLVMGDFLDFQDDKQSVKSDPTTSTDWAQFESTPDSSLIVDKVEQSGVSWSAFGGGGGDQSSTKTTPPTNLLDSQPKIDDPFGLDALQNSPPSIAAPVLNAVSNEVTNEQGQHQQTLDNILKLYDAPKPRNEAPLPPNLGLPMGSVHGTMPGLYPVIPGQSAGVYNPGMPMPQGGLYPQSIMVPQMGFQQPGYYQPQGSNGYFHQSYNGQGPR